MVLDLNNKKTVGILSTVFCKHGIAGPITEETVLKACQAKGSEFVDEIEVALQQSPIVAMEGGAATPSEPVVYDRILNLPQPIFFMAIGAIIALLVVFIKK